MQYKVTLSPEAQEALKSKAAKAGLDPEDFLNQIINACLQENAVTAVLTPRMMDLLSEYANARYLGLNRGIELILSEGVRSLIKKGEFDGHQDDYQRLMIRFLKGLETGVRLEASELETLSRYLELPDGTITEFYELVRFYEKRKSFSQIEEKLLRIIKDMV